jgi:two-component system sensor histidine kinase KdpD
MWVAVCDKGPSRMLHSPMKPAADPLRWEPRQSLAASSKRRWGALGRHLAPSIEWLLGVPVAGACALIATFIAPWAQLADQVTVHLLGVLAIAARLPLWPSLFAAVLNILAFDFFIIPPAYVISWPDGRSAVTFVGMLVVAGVVSGLNQGLRRERESARRGEARTQALYEFSRDLSDLRTVEQLSESSVQTLERVFDARVIVAFWNSEADFDAATLQGCSPLEQHMARRAWLRGEVTQDMSEGGYGVWCPLLGSHGRVGVLGLAPRTASKFEDQETVRLLQLMASQIGGALERTMLSSAAHQAQLRVEAEQMRSSLLAAVSHDLKTPLGSILTAATILDRADQSLPPESRRELLRTVVDEAERLNRLVSNLLSMTKLEAGKIVLKREAADIEDLISEALGAVAGRQGKRSIEVRIDEELPLVEVDATLVQQVLINTLENALRYTPEGSGIEILAVPAAEGVRISVSDEGPGVPIEERDKVFEKFFRGRGVKSGDGGVGLGLTICRAAIEAHGGRIRMGQSEKGGARVEFTLPKASRTPAGLD